MKVTRTFSVDEKEYNKFKLITRTLGLSQAEILQDFMRTFNITHTHEFNEKLNILKKENEL